MHRGACTIVFLRVMVVATVLVVAGIAAEAWLSQRSTPAAAGFMPVEAQAHFVTGPIGDLWEALAVHFSRAFSDDASFEVGNVTGSIRDILAERCLPLKGRADLESYGLDVRRGAGFALLDESSGVVALPVADRDRFVAFLASLQARSGPVSLSADGSRKVHQIRIDRLEIEGARLCRTYDPTPIAATTGTSVGLGTGGRAVVDLFAAVPAGGNPARLMIACTAIYDDDTTGPCRCDADGVDCSQALRADATAPLQTVDERTGFEVLRFLSTAGDAPLWEPEGSAPPAVPDAAGDEEDSVSLAAVFTDNSFAVLSNSEAVALASAVRGTTPNFRQSDDSGNRVSLDAMSEYRPGDGLLFGGVNWPMPPVYGNVAVAVLARRQDVQVEAFVPLRTDDLTLLHRLLTPVSETPDPYPRDVHAVEFRMFDKWIPYYADFLPDLGAFEDLRQRIAWNEAAESFAVDFAVVSEGVPYLFLSMSIDRERAEALILEERRQLRAKRDARIIEAAAASLSAEAAPAIGDLGLAPEPNPLWSRYEFIYSLDDERWVVVGGPSAEDLASGYSVEMAGRKIEYLAPPFTANDLKYRVTEGRESIDADALMKDRFRLAAWYDEDSGQLVIGADAESLSDYLDTRGWAGTQAASSLPPAGKAVMRTAPRPLIGGMLDYPNEEVGDIARNYLRELEQFTRLDGRVSPAPDRKAIVIHLQAGY